MRYAVACAVLVAGCAAVPQAPVTAPAPAGPVSKSIAVASLVEAARADSGAGRLASAAASLERALRIEPRNPHLWQELARVRLKQGEYDQAESIAARSNSWATGDAGLRAENWRLIAEARAARGDDTGARAALERSRQAGR